MLFSTTNQNKTHTLVAPPWKQLVESFQLGHLTADREHVRSVIDNGVKDAASYKLDPKETYLWAWKLIRDSYYDPGFSGQNWAFWKHHFDSEIRTLTDAHHYIKVVLDSLKDPYTYIQNEEASKDSSLTFKYLARISRTKPPSNI